MNAPKITKIDVERAIAKLEASATPVSANTVLKTLGRGGKSTVLKLLKEIEADRQRSEAEKQEALKDQLLKAYPLPDNLATKFEAAANVLNELPVLIAEVQSAADAQGRKSLENQMSGMTVRYEKKQQDLEDQIDALQQERQEMVSALAAIENERDALQSALTTSQGDLKAAGQRIVELEAQLQAENALEKRLSALMSRQAPIELDDVPKNPKRRRNLPNRTKTDG